MTRNRTKRVVRALVATRLEQLPGGTDLVVRANPAAAGEPTARLEAEVDRLLPDVLRRLRSATGAVSGAVSG